MEFKDGRIHGFKPKFKSVGKDTERYLFALLELAEAGKIQEVPGKSLYATHYDEGYEWILDCYFEKRLFDQLESHFMPQTGDFFTPFYPRTRKYLDRMLELGESPRVRRIWRAKIGLMKAEYWHFIRARGKGYVYDPALGYSTETKQRHEYESVAARIPALKETLLAVMADYRALLVKLGASPAELARVDADIAAIEAEERPTPKGKPDNRPMTEDVLGNSSTTAWATGPLVNGSKHCRSAWPCSSRRPFATSIRSFARWTTLPIARISGRWPICFGADARMTALTPFGAG